MFGDYLSSLASNLGTAVMEAGGMAHTPIVPEQALMWSSLSPVGAFPDIILGIEIRD